MKLVLKILVLPVSLVLSVLTAVCAFVFTRAAILLGLASAILSTLAVMVFLADSAKNAGIVLGIAFLISPYGLPRLGAFLLGGLMLANESIKSFIHG